MYADILLPLRIPRPYTYIVPEEFQSKIEIGFRVLVSFGKSKLYAGIVTKLHENEPDSTNIKLIEEVIDTKPILSDIQLKFWSWLADYYMCNLGEVMDSALPNYFKLSSERFFEINTNIELENYQLEENEQMVFDSIQSMGQLSLNEIKNSWGQKQGISSLNKLIDKGLINPIDIIKDKYKPKYEKFVKLKSSYIKDTNELNKVFSDLEKKSKHQWKALLTYFSIDPNYQGISKLNLSSKAEETSSVINGLVDKEILTEYQIQVDRFSLEKFEQLKKPVLSEKQKQVYQDIKDQFQSKSIVLLRGITGSGKTEIYIQWIQEALKSNKTSLLILPEIALTQQIVSRLNAYFGSEILIYHSMVSQNKRFEIWNRIYSGQVKFIVGTRSAIFLPFQTLDQIIIDEEHDSSLKQSDSNPKFHVRDAFIYYAQFFGAKILLGSATPSLESYYNATNEKYGYVELLERFGSAQIPEIELIPLSDKNIAQDMKSYYSKPLLNQISNTVELGQQVILFQNRRGYAPYIQCNTCSFVQKCDHCDVRLTYHTYHKQLLCHYCNKKYKLYPNCLQCKSTELKTKGLGTQKVEEEIQLFLPQLKLLRLDLDVASSASKIDQVFEDFKSGEFNVLIGTQMVSKGLDFENLTLVGVVQADNFFSFIDYKTDEKAFQILSQVSGRVGRGVKSGKVLIQIHDIQNKIVQFVINHDWQGFVDRELAHRKEFIYPPFCKLIKISIKHIKEDLVKIYADKIADKIRNEIQSHVLGPTVPPISRIRNQYIQEILIKLPKDKTLNSNKNLIKTIIDKEMLTMTNRNFLVDILVDV